MSKITKTNLEQDLRKLLFKHNIEVEKVNNFMEEAVPLLNELVNNSIASVLSRTIRVEPRDFQDMLEVVKDFIESGTATDLQLISLKQLEYKLTELSHLYND
jgi:FtsZ-interacting cell division protein YlmF